MTKSIFSSKTFWIAVLQFVAGGITAVVASDPAVGTIGWIAMAKSIVDVIIRILTTKPISA